MHPSLFILIVFGSIPLMNELEVISSANGRFPRPFEIIALRITMKERWFKGYIILVLLFIIISIAPTSSGKIYSIGLISILIAIISNIILWVYAIFRARRNIGQRSKKYEPK